MFAEFAAVAGVLSLALLALNVLFARNPRPIRIRAKGRSTQGLPRK